MQQLLWSDVAPGRDFHAAFIDIRAVRSYVMPPHGHDFHELIWVLSGRARHETPGASFALTPHTLVLVRPDDAHSVVVPRGETLRYINVAFRSELWREFLQLAKLAVPEDAAPPHRVVAEAKVGAVVDAFERVLRAWHEEKTARWPLLQLWSAAAPLLLDAGTVEFDRTLENAPEWLRRGADAMREAENLRGGVTRFQDICGVSAGHLSRTLRTHCGQTPAEWILERKLERAARLLSTTSLAVEEIARDCGFENSAYFYRTFARRYASSPRAFRLEARQLVAP